MVATVQPSSTAGLGIDPRVSRDAPRTPAEQSRSRDLDPVSAAAEGQAAAWRAARESVRAALAKLDLSLAAGRAALETLNAGGAEAQSEVARIADRATASGASLLAGGVLRVQSEADAPAFEIAGIELKSFTDPAALERALDGLRGAAQRLEAHDGFLAALEHSVSVSVRADLDADGARLLALQVRQGLSESAGAIANTQPDSVLGLFRG